MSVAIASLLDFILHVTCPRRMATSYHIAFTVIDEYDVMYIVEKTDANVGSGRRRRFLD
jgi:hypothetical protein